ncbi:hypothetical protein mckay_60 [Escherichia phage mckay]|uniref:Uncharacterized protein n=1 Tax=Escherichia phage mckay TaxID=2696416 RepID=A0A6B9X9X8_9CAUD|nr:hypothetical protein P9620_gp60 [Escherichia phage mckay]QHR73504.1 hypothetical protein mckay_60 [Escherichia phage mckay]
MLSEKCSLQLQQIAINFFMRMFDIGCIQPGTLLYWLHTNMRTEQWNTKTWSTNC